MTPDQVRDATASLQHAVDSCDDDAAGLIAMQICCGAALNLAVIAQHLTTPRPIWVGCDFAASDSISPPA